MDQVSQLQQELEFAGGVGQVTTHKTSNHGAPTLSARFIL